MGNMKMCYKVSVLSCFFMLMCVLTSTCFAHYSDKEPLPNSEVALGGITLGSTMDYVKSIYGEPDETGWTTDTFGNRTLYHRYGNGFYLLEGTYGGGSSINELTSKANNGLATPSGITVGTTLDTVKSIYGENQLIKWKALKKHLEDDGFIKNQGKS